MLPNKIISSRKKKTTKHKTNVGNSCTSCTPQYALIKTSTQKPNYCNIPKRYILCNISFNDKVFPNLVNPFHQWKKIFTIIFNFQFPRVFRNIYV